MANVWTLKKPEDIAVSQVTKPIWGNTYCGDVTLYNVSTVLTVGYTVPVPVPYKDLSIPYTEVYLQRSIVMYKAMAYDRCRSMHMIGVNKHNLS